MYMRYLFHANGFKFAEFVYSVEFNSIEFAVRQIPFLFLGMLKIAKQFWHTRFFFGKFS